MRRDILFAGAAAVLAVTALLSRKAISSFSNQESVFEPVSAVPQPAPMCPWRNPEADLPRLFPEATRFEVQTRVLSGYRPELTSRLGRSPTPEENVLQVYRIYREDQPLGELATRRVKGAFGAIEVVIAVDNSGGVKGMLLQRLREPQAITDALLAVDWARWLGGKGADSSWDGEELLASLPSNVRDSAQAIVRGARSVTILLAVSGRAAHLDIARSHEH